MRGKHALAFLGSFALAATVSAQAPQAGTGAVYVPAADLKWAPLNPAVDPRVLSADVWGDHTKGAFGGFTKFPAGFQAPLHTHTNTLKIVVISGTFIHTPEGKPAVRLGPGSYLMQPGGTYKHTTACDPASECLFFMQSEGKFDLIPVETAKK